MDLASKASLKGGTPREQVLRVLGENASDRTFAWWFWVLVFSPFWDPVVPCQKGDDFGRCLGPAQSYRT